MPFAIKLLTKIHASLMVLGAVAFSLMAIFEGKMALLAIPASCLLILMEVGLISLGNSLAENDTAYFKGTIAPLLGGAID